MFAPNVNGVARRWFVQRNLFDYTYCYITNVKYYQATLNIYFTQKNWPIQQIYNESIIFIIIVITSSLIKNSRKCIQVKPSKQLSDQNLIQFHFVLISYLRYFYFVLLRFRKYESLLNDYILKIMQFSLHQGTF